MQGTAGPYGWKARHQVELSVPLPDGVTFWSTPSHGYLRVDLRKHSATITAYDYVMGDFALLEEDCSATVWLMDNGVIPYEPYIEQYR